MEMLTVFSLRILLHPRAHCAWLAGQSGPSSLPPGQTQDGGSPLAQPRKVTPWVPGAQ